MQKFGYQFIKKRCHRDENEKTSSGEETFTLGSLRESTRQAEAEKSVSFVLQKRFVF